MTVLVIAEHKDGKISAATLRAVTAAGQLGGSVTLLVGAWIAKTLRMPPQPFPGLPRCFMPMVSLWHRGWPSRWQIWWRR